VKLIIQKEKRNKNIIKYSPNNRTKKETKKKQNKTEKNTIKNTRFRNNRISIFGLSSGVIPLVSSPDIGIQAETLACE
jgi:hypothetical protein